MNTLVLYSSRTGNTKKVAEAIGAALGATIRPVRDMGDVSDFDLVFVGFWAFRRGADMEARQAIGKMTGKKIAIFGTAGAYPDSDASKSYIENTAALVKEANTYLGGFICQGRVHSFHVNRRSMHTNEVHPLTPERKARLEEAEKHPDALDEKQAAAFAKEMAAKAESL